MNLARPIHQAARLVLARQKRVGRLVVFGFEQLFLTRLLERHRTIAESITHSLLKTRSVEKLPPELVVRKDGEMIESWSHGFTAINAALFLNLRNPDDLSPFRHALPGPPFRAVYLWDSAFIAQIWKWWEPAVGWDILRSVVELRDGDRLQHFVSEFAKSTLTQPPLIAWSLNRLSETVNAEQYKAWVELTYEPLRAYHRWLQNNRRLPNGLYAWAHTYESGVENAPRFSSTDERYLADTRSRAAPDFCSYMVLECEALATMARQLGRLNDAASFDREAESLRAGTNEHLWDEESGLYFDRDMRTGAFIKSRTIASLLPLWAGIPDPRRAQRLRDHILAPDEFNTLIPLPSVALNDPAFERDMWRGPVWLNTAFAVVEGLRRYRFHEAAADIAFRLCDGVYHCFGLKGRFYEFYDPTAYGIDALHRKRGNRWKHITLGSKPVADFVGWTGLVNTMALETLVGLQRTQHGFAIQPRFPRAAHGLAFSLTAPLLDLKLEFHVQANGRCEGQISGPDGTHLFSAAFGEQVHLLPDRHSSAAAAR